MNRKYLISFLAGLSFVALVGATFKSLMLDESGNCSQNVNFTGTATLNSAAIATQAYSDGLVSSHNSDGSAHADKLKASNNLSDVSSASTARTNLGLGTAATQTVGTSAGNVVQLDGSAKLPAVDGSALTNLPAAGESNTASNLGTGTGVFAQKSGVDLQFKSLIAGTNIEITYDSTGITIAATGSASGEANTASNIGVGGVGVFAQKSGVDLQFKNIIAGSNKVLVSDDTADSEIAIDVQPGNIAHQDLSGAGTNTHTQIDNHIASTSNPHSVTAAQSGAVATSGDETVAGVKTFSSSPIVPTPTTDYQAATKKYVDDNAGGSVTGATITTETGDLTSDDANKIVTVQQTTGDTYTKTQMHFDGDIVDATGLTTATDSGTSSSTSTKKFGTASRYFGGSAYIQNSTPVTIGTGNFTIEMWVYVPAFSGYQDFFATQNRTTGGFSVGTGTSNQITFYDGAETIRVNSVFTASTWHHVCIMRSSGTVYAFVDGVLKGSAAWTRNFTDTAYRLGSLYSGSEYLTGYIDEFRISTTARYSTSGFTPSTSAFADSVFVYDKSIAKISDINFGICQGRLTLESGVPVSTTDQTAKTTLYFTPNITGQNCGNKITVYDGTKWVLYSFSERSLSLSGFTASTNYDIFVYDNSGTLTLSATAWTNDTTRATALTTQDGIYVKSGATNYRYIGTIRITSTTGQCEDSGFGNSTGSKRFVWNMYNRVRTKNHTYTTTDTWTDAGNGTWSQLNDATSVFKHEFVIGISQQVDAFLSAYAVNSNSSIPIVAIGKDSVTSLDRTFSGVGTSAVASLGITLAVPASGIFAAGYHYVAGMENTTASGTALFFGDNGPGNSAAITQSCFESTIER